MSFVQKLLLTLLGIFTLLIVGFSIIYMYILLGVPRQKAIESDCVFKESGECLHYEKVVQTWVVQTHSAMSNPSSTIIPSTNQPELIAYSITPTNIISTASPTPSPNTIQTATPITEAPNAGSMKSPPADEWREFSIVPYLSAHSKQILLNAMENGYLDSHTFVKVGDCHMESGIFLSGYIKGSYRIPTGLEDTVQWFSEGMVTDNITAVNGYGINTVLDPTYAFTKGNEHCFINETPLDCELRTKRPSIVLIAMGTNWVPHGEESFEKYLRVVVLRILETGALPILATKADNLEGDWKINHTIAQVSIDYDIPLVNVWSAMQDLPRKGLQPDAFHLTGDGWLRNSSTWLKTLEKVYQIVSQ